MHQDLLMSLCLQWFVHSDHRSEDGTLYSCLDCSKGVLEWLPEFGSKSTISVGYDGYRCTMSWDNFFDVQSGKLFHFVSLFDLFKMCGFCGTINYDPDGVITAWCLWELGNEVHSNSFPFSHRKLWLLQWTGWFLMFGFHFGECKAFANVCCNIGLHVWPSIE